MKQLETISHIEIINEMDKIQENILKEISEYNMYKAELGRRFPPILENPAFDLKFESEENVKAYSIKHKTKNIR